MHASCAKRSGSPAQLVRTRIAPVLAASTAVLIAAVVATAAMLQHPGSTPQPALTATSASASADRPSLFEVGFGPVCGQKAADIPANPLVASNLTINWRFIHSSAAEGTIVSTVPACGTAIPLGSTLTVNISQ